MKTKYITHLLAATLLLTTSCSRNFSDDPQISVTTKGVMEVEVTEKNGKAEDKIQTIRFIVFKDPNTSPRLEVNKLFLEGDFSTTGATGGLDVSKLRILLEVSRRQNGPNDKMVVIIANEPPTMTGVLDRITDPNELADLRLAIADFINDDHRSLKANTPMPMTSVVWTNKVYPTEVEATADLVPISLTHVVARVDVYLKKETSLDSNIKLALGTKITLQNTYDNEFFIRHISAENTFGQVQTITSGFIDRAWTLEVQNTEITDTSPICSFYTPERTCTENKLVLKVEAITSEGATRQGQVTIEKAFDINSIESEIKVIERNNVYKVIATVGVNEINCVVNNWNSEDIYTEL